MKRSKNQRNDKQWKHQSGLSDEEPLNVDRDQLPCLMQFPGSISATSLPPLGTTVRFPTTPLPFRAAIAPAHGFDSTSFVSLIGNGPAFQVLAPHESEQQRRLALQILLQRQEEQQAARVAEAVATAYSSIARQVESATVARAQIERASTHLLSQEIFPLGGTGSASNQTTVSLRPQAAGSHQQEPSVSNQDDEVRQHLKLPDPSSDSDQSDEDSEEPKYEHMIEPFPIKLYRILEEAEDNGDDHIVSFFPHGKAFVVHKPREFVNDLMPKYFSTTRYSSFQRQLNVYGFRRINRGQEKGGYFHDYFIRGRKSLCKKIARKKPDKSGDTSSTGRLGYSSAAVLAKDSTSNPSAGFARPDIDQLSQHIAYMHYVPRSAPSSTVPFSNNAPWGILQSSMQRDPISAAGFTLPTRALQGFASELGRPLLPAIGATAAVGLMAEAQRIASVVVALDRRQSELERRWLGRLIIFVGVG